MTDKPSDRAIAHLARIAVSHLDDSANGSITPALNAALRRLREELDKTNAGYAAAPEGAQAVVACHRTITENGSAWAWVAGAPSLGALDNLKVHPNWRIEYAYTTPPSLGGEDRALREDAERYRFLREPGNAIVYAKDLTNWNQVPYLPANGSFGLFKYDSPEKLDAGIDDARAAEGGERG